MIHYDPAPNYPAPAHPAYIGLQELEHYLVGHCGGTSLGIFADRPMRGSTHPSLHRDGRALDWRHDDLQTRWNVCNFLVANAEAFQIQAVHHYYASQAWRPDEGWHITTGPNFGSPTALWLHIERTYIGARDTRPIGEILAPVVTPPQPKADPDMELWKVSDNPAASSLWLVGASAAPFSVNGAEIAALNKSRSKPLEVIPVLQSTLTKSGAK